MRSNRHCSTPSSTRIRAARAQQAQSSQMAPATHLSGYLKKEGKKQSLLAADAEALLPGRGDRAAARRRAAAGALLL